MNVVMVLVKNAYRDKSLKKRSELQLTLSVPRNGLHDLLQEILQKQHCKWIIEIIGLKVSCCIPTFYFYLPITKKA